MVHWKITKVLENWCKNYEVLHFEKRTYVILALHCFTAVFLFLWIKTLLSKLLNSRKINHSINSVMIFSLHTTIVVTVCWGRGEGRWEGKRWCRRLRIAYLRIGINSLHESLPLIHMVMFMDRGEEREFSKHFGHFKSTNSIHIRRDNRHSHICFFRITEHIP